MMHRILLALSLLACSSANAVITMNLWDTSYNDADAMILSFSGSVDTTELEIGQETTVSTYLNLSLSHIASSDSNASVNLYYGEFSGPLSIGVQNYLGVYVSGDSMAISPLFGMIYLPTDYVSGTFISGQSLFVGTTVAEMGLTLGDSFEWTWGSGGTADKVVFVIGEPIPEPATVTLLGAGATALLVLALRRRKTLSQN